MSLPTGHDSDSDFSLTPMSGAGNVGAARPWSAELPLIDLTGSGPLPSLPPLNSRAPQTAPAASPNRSTTRRPPSAPAPASPASPPALSPRDPSPQPSGPGAIWLDGDVLMCVCPDCRSPMTIRLWLMAADCWCCGTSIELTEAQEREVQRLLEQREPARPVAARTPMTPPVVPALAPTAAPTPAARPRVAPPAQRPSPPAPPTNAPPKGVERAAPPVERPTPPPVATQPVVAPPVAPPPVAAPASRPRPPHRSVLARRAPDPWLKRLFKNVPAGLISLIVHTVMITLLALITFEEKKEQLVLIVTTAVSRERDDAAFKTRLDKTDDPKFDLPLPDNVNLKDKKIRDAMVEADQHAKELRLDPNAPNLPDLQQVKQLASSDDPVRRSLAVRDPRLRVEIAKIEGGTTLTEAAVARGLRWLASQQKADGRWGDRGQEWSMAETSLALLPFLGAGQTHFSGKYQDTVAKGLRWLISQQAADGDLRGGKSPQPGMYGHGIGSIVLCDAFGMTGDETLRQPAQKALQFIVAAQNNEGGWRYVPRQDADLSVVGWQLMALQSGKMAGLTVPKETLELVDHYLDTVSHDKGAQYSYQRRASPKPTMTAEGLLCRMYLGWNRDNPGLTRGVQHLTKYHLPTKSEPNIYYWYYGTQVFHHVGGEPWEAWNRRIRELLVNGQITEGRDAGSWPVETGGHGGGTIYVTALSICSLEVYYRHAPIYRKIKLN